MLSERGLCDCVLAFRSLGKNNIHFANDAFKEIQRRESCEAIGLDIKGFFDNLDHALVKGHGAMFFLWTGYPPTISIYFGLSQNFVLLKNMHYLIGWVSKGIIPIMAETEFALQKTFEMWFEAGVN